MFVTLAIVTVLGVFLLMGILLYAKLFSQHNLRINNVDFDQYKTKEIQKNGHYHKIVQ